MWKIRKKLRIILTKKPRLHCKQGFFLLQTRLLFTVNKASFQCKEALSLSAHILTHAQRNTLFGRTMLFSLQKYTFYKKYLVIFLVRGGKNITFAAYY